MTCTCFSSNALQALFFSIVSLSDSRIKLMTAACIITLELVVNLCRCAEFLLKAICTNEWRRSVHFIEIKDFFRNINIWCSIIKLLLYKLVTENMTEFIRSNRFQCSRIKKRSRFFLHISTNVVPLLWEFIFF